VREDHFISAVGAGKRRRARHLVRADGRALLVALDHAAYMGEGPPQGALMRAVADGRPDGVLATWQVARANADVFADAGLILRIDGGVSELGERSAADISTILYRTEQAVALGADAVAIMVFPGAPDEEHSLRRLAQLSAECELLGVPLMAESIPGGWGRAIPWTVENVGRAARLSVELGADIVKTVCPGPTAEFAAVVEACPAPVVALGGPRMESEDDVVALAAGVVAAGAAGIAFGRNVWGSPDPAKLLARLHEAVHGKTE